LLKAESDENSDMPINYCS